MGTVRERAPSPREVLIELQKLLRKEVGDAIVDKLHIFNVCGSEQVKLQRHFDVMKRHGMVTVPHQGEDCALEKPQYLCYVAEASQDKLTTLHSSAVVHAVLNGDTNFVKNSMSPEASRFILEPTEEE